MKVNKWKLVGFILTLSQRRTDLPSAKKKVDLKLNASEKIYRP